MLENSALALTHLEETGFDKDVWGRPEKLMDGVRGKDGNPVV